MGKKRKKKARSEIRDRAERSRTSGAEAAVATPSLSLSLVLLTVITVICLVPFVNKAFHMDDPLFIWAAQQIQRNPADFYGFKVNWSGTEMPMSAATMNPPLASYYIALAASLVGWGEVALHLAFLIPAIAAVLGTYFLARQFCTQPLGATLAGMLTPVFLVSSTNLMCDTMMLAFWVWAMFFWVLGMDRDKPLLLLLSGFLIAASALTKFYGVGLIPLLLAYSFVRERHLRKRILFLLFPVVVIGVYHWITQMLYGKGLSSVASFSLHTRWQGGARILPSMLTGLSFVGGCLISTLFYSPLLWRRKVLAAGALALALSPFILPYTGIFTNVKAEAGWGKALQLGLFILTGICLLALVASDFRQRRDAGSVLLLLWIAGTFVFGTFVNWTVNARSILPMAPAAGIILMRRIEEFGERPFLRGPLGIFIPIIPALIISLFVTWADSGYANTARTAAMKINHEYGKPERALWFQGHWGFQYYMESYGGKAVDFEKSRFNAGDIIVIPIFNSNIYHLPQELVWLEKELELSANGWFSTGNQVAGAGFYSDIYGPLPYVVGPVPPERYTVLSVRKSIQLKK